MITSFIDYINTCMASETIGAYISLGSLALVALLALSGLLLGVGRGFSKSAIRLITVVASAVCAFLVAGSIGTTLFEQLESKTPEQFMMSIYPDYATLGESVRGMINSIDIPTLENILAIFLCVLVPLVFIVMFLLLNAVTMLFYWLLSGLMGITSFEKSSASTIAGGLIGMLQGAFIALVLLFPLAETTVIAGNVRDELTAESVAVELSETVDAVYEEHLNLLIDNPVFKGINKLGGKALYDSLSTYKINGVEYVMTEQTENMARLVAHVSSLKGFDFKAPTAENKATIDAILKDIDDTPYVADIIAGTLRTLGNIIDNGYYDLELGELLNDVVHTTIVILKDSSTETLHNDLITIRDVYYILVDNDVLTTLTSGDTEAIAKVLSSSLSGESIINQVISVLDANPHTRPIISTLTKISLSVMAESTGMSAEEMEELYNNVHEGVTNILSIEFKYDPELYESEEEYKEVYTEQVSTELEQTLANNGIEGIDKETIDEMASIIADKNIERQAEGKTEITDQEINDAILTYYEAYAKQNGLSGDISQDFPGGIPNIDDVLGGNEGTEGSENTEE